MTRAKARRALSPILLIMTLCSFWLATSPTGGLKSALLTILVLALLALAVAFSIAKPFRPTDDPAESP